MMVMVIVEMVELYSSSWATERHRPYGMTQFLPAIRHRWMRPAITAAKQAGT